jgi:hypothetical protein
VSARFGASGAAACVGTIDSYYINGAVGSSPSEIYDDSSGTVLSSAGWYRVLSSSTAYEWDGTDWTGNSYTCS